MKIKTEISEYKKEQEKLNALKEKIRNAFIQQIDSFPQNNFIEQKSTNPSIFIMSSKNLSSQSWSPSFYDNKALAQLVIERIQRMDDIDNIIDFLSDIVDTHCFQAKNKNKVVCNENFVKELEKILKTIQ